MKLALKDEGSEILLKLDMSQAKFHEIWLVESLKAVWELWTRMGWCPKVANTITTMDWNLLCPPAEKKTVISDISRFNHLVAGSDFEIEDRFDEGWACIIQIVASIQRNGLYFESGPEIILFRRLVAKFSLFGINKGIIENSPDHSEFFIFTIKNELIPPPIIYMQDFEIEFIAHKTEATVTLKFDKVTNKEGYSYEAHL